MVIGVIKTKGKAKMKKIGDRGSYIYFPAG
jgi:hypothetical protein